MLLLLAPKNEVVSSYIEFVLENKKIEYVTFEYPDFPASSMISFELSQTGYSFILKTENKEIDLKKITAVWNYRRYEAKADPGLRTDFRNYIQKESEVFLESLHMLTPQAYWFPDNRTARYASCKPYQLDVASQLGLNVPKTYAGNDPDKAKDFLSDKTDVAIKPFRYNFLEADLNFWQKLIGSFAKILVKTGTCFDGDVQRHANEHGDDIKYYNRMASGTVKVSTAELLGKIDDIELCPVIIQEYIEKKYELRIIVIGNKVFACVIYSQAGPELAKIDWRSGEDKVKIEPFTLPEEIERKCIQLNETLGLEFGCMDFIVTPDDNYVFLENNTNGQWYMFEELTGLPIGMAIADHILQKSGHI